MGQYDNILLIEIKDPTKLNEMEKYLLKKYNLRIEIPYKVGAIITVRFENISEKELMKKIKSERGVKEVTKYSPC